MSFPKRIGLGDVVAAAATLVFALAALTSHPIITVIFVVAWVIRPYVNTKQEL